MPEFDVEDYPLGIGCFVTDPTPRTLCSEKIAAFEAETAARGTTSCEDSVLDPAIESEALQPSGSRSRITTGDSTAWQHMVTGDRWGEMPQTGYDPLQNQLLAKHSPVAWPPIAHAPLPHPGQDVNQGGEWKSQR